MIESIEILGVRIHRVTMAETVAQLEAMLGTRKRQIIVPVNPEMIMAAQSNAPFRDTINRAALALPDGVGVLWASRLTPTSIRERVTGIDTVLRFMSVAARTQALVFLLGAAPGVAERAADQLRAWNPGLRVAGTFAGSPDPAEEDALCEKINNAKTDILLIAYGAPKQELWLSRNASKLAIDVAICTGGAFDFVAGIKQRSPRWMQILGIEWLYRLIQEPSRWRRMLALPRFAFRVLIRRFA